MQPEEAAERVWRIRERLQREGVTVELNLDAAHAITLLMTLSAIIEEKGQEGSDMTEEMAIANAILVILGHEDPELFTLIDLSCGEPEWFTDNPDHQRN